MRVWAVRHKATGKFFVLQESGRSFKGQTSSELGTDKIRFFYTQRAANIALGAYCKGEWVQGYQPSSWQNLAFDGKEPFLDIDKSKARPRADYEVVEYRLVEVRATGV